MAFQRFVQSKNATLAARCITRHFTAANAAPVEVRIHDNKATLTLATAPNVLTLSTLKTLREAIKDLELNAEVDALVVTASPGSSIFCAGLDLLKFHKPDPKDLYDYWQEMQCLVTELYFCRLATVARLNGHTIAGGCLLAMACDYRVMQRGAKIGLNEAALGMTLPWWLPSMLTSLVGPRHSERLICAALLPSADDAMNIGLVDNVGDDEAALDVEVASELKRLLAVPASARAANKRAMRRPLASNMQEQLANDCHNFAAEVSSAPLQAAIGKYMEQLANKKKK